MFPLSHGSVSSADTDLIENLSAMVSGIWDADALLAELVAWAEPSDSLSLLILDSPAWQLSWYADAGFSRHWVSDAKLQLPTTYKLTDTQWSAPLVTQGQCVGILTLNDQTADQQAKRFTPWLSWLAAMVQQLRLSDQCRQLMLERLLVQQLALSLRPTDPPHALIQHVCQHLRQQLTIQHVWFEPSETALASGYSGEMAPEYASLINRFLTGSLAIENDSDRHQVDPSILWLPVVTGGLHYWGVLGLQTDHWPGHWVAALTEVVALLADTLHQNELIHQLRHKTETLTQTLTSLQQTQLQLIQTEKLAVIGQFVAGIAHEVNTPLGVVMSNQQLMLDLLAQGRDGNSLKDLLTLSHQACERMSQTVRNLKAFARLDAPQDRMPVDLLGGIQDTLSILRSSIPPGIEVCIDPQTTAQAWGVPGLLNMVWMNLIVNAMQAMGDQGRLSLRTYQPNLAGDTVIVQVSDTGCGIPPEVLPRIFDPGYTTKGPGVGTGLGLSLCYQIVHQHHQGQLQIQSAPQAGTTVTVVLPVR